MCILLETAMVRVIEPIPNGAVLDKLLLAPLFEVHAPEHSSTVQPYSHVSMVVNTGSRRVEKLRQAKIE